MNTANSQSLESIQDGQTLPDGYDSAIIKCFEAFSAVTTGGLYVLNIPQMKFCYIKPDNLFLCGFSVEDALTLGYDFYSNIIYPDDWLLWKDMSEAVWLYLKDNEENREEIDYFSCTFRLQRSCSFLTRPFPQMIYQRMKPVWENNEWRYLVCTVEGSTIRKAGNLCIYNKDGICEEYNLKTKRWERKTIDPLTERERTILMLAEQGKTSGEIAGVLCREENTIRNQINRLFSKLEVHSMQEAIEVACSHQLIYPNPDIEQQPVEAPLKRTRVLLTEDQLQRIQQYLDDGKSIREAARLEGITERAIRYWIDKRRLKK